MAHDNWHKIVGVMMLKFGVTDVEILPEDVMLLGDNDKCVVADCRGDRFVIRVMSMAEGERIARNEGGLPV